MPPPFTAFPIPTVLLTDVLFAPASMIVAGGTFNLGVANDGDMVISTSSPVTIQLPDSTGRSGRPVRISDVSGSPSVTVLTFGGQTVFGTSSIAMRSAYGGMTLWPLATGGWYGA